MSETVDSTDRTEPSICAALGQTGCVREGDIKGMRGCGIVIRALEGAAFGAISEGDTTVPSFKSGDNTATHILSTIAECQAVRIRGAEACAKEYAIAPFQPACKQYAADTRVICPAITTALVDGGGYPVSMGVEARAYAGSAGSIALQMLRPDCDTTTASDGILKATGAARQIASTVCRACPQFGQK
jgi:hypothetical protein